MILTSISLLCDVSIVCAGTTSWARAVSVPALYMFIGENTHFHYLRLNKKTLFLEQKVQSWYLKIPRCQLIEKNLRYLRNAKKMYL